MLDAVKKYATQILLIHCALLVIVILLVLGGARQVQLSAREEAQVQSKERLQLLADQTARGVESNYQSILSDLLVILKGDESAATMPAAASQPALGGGGGRGYGNPATQPRGGAGGGRYAGRGGRGRGGPPPNPLAAPVQINESTLATIWRQLHQPSQERVSQIFVADRTTGDIFRQPGPGEGFSMVFPQSSLESAKKLLADPNNLEWLKSVKDVEMSTFKFASSNLPGEPRGYHLIAIPAQVGRGVPGGPGGAGGIGRGPFGGGGEPGAFGRGGDGRGGPFEGGQPSLSESPFVVVVVVPMDHVRDQFLDPLNNQGGHEVNAILVNDSGQVLVSSNLQALGSNLLDEVDDATRAALKPLVNQDNAAPVVLSKPFHVGATTIAPQIVASARLTVPSGHSWTVLISSPLSEAEDLVNQTFRSAAGWALFVTLSITAILISTSMFLIRSRVRLERTRHEILTRELEQARHIQLAWLPDVGSAPAGIDISAANLPANHISGDFYNWFELPRGNDSAGAGGQNGSFRPTPKIAIVIGDVTGHGMAAAFLMATTQLLVRMTLLRHQDAGRCLREVNQQLCAQGFQGQFVTMLVMVLDPVTNTIEIGSAGHPAPLVETRGGKAEFKPLGIEPQLVLGVNPDEDYRSESFMLEPGASVILYTDGVVEAEGASGAQYGVENLVRLLHSQNVEESVRRGVGGAGVDPAQRIRAILEDVKRFCNNRELLDDVTLVALRTSPAVVESFAATEAD